MGLFKHAALYTMALLCAGWGSAKAACADDHTIYSAKDGWTLSLYPATDGSVASLFGEIDWIILRQPKHELQFVFYETTSNGIPENDMFLKEASGKDLSPHTRVYPVWKRELQGEKPTEGRVPPDYVLTTDLMAGFYYWPQNKQSIMPPEVWHLTGCRSASDQTDASKLSSTLDKLRP